MKKSFVLLLILVVLISGTAYYAQNELLKERDQVHYTEKVLYGDKSVVEGVAVEADMQYNYNLYWNTRYEIGDTPKEDTKYSFYPWGYIEAVDSYPGSLHLVMDNQMRLQVGNDDFEKESYYGLDVAIKEVYDKTAPGTENIVTVYLKDYLEYYNFGLDLRLPDKVGGTFYGHYISFNEQELREDLAHYEKTGLNKEEAKKLKKYLEALDIFQEFFKIPVMETEVYKIGMTKDENGVVTGMSEASVHGGSATGDMNFPDMSDVAEMDSFGLYTFSVFDAGDCYFSFDPHTFNDNVVDVSQIPGGYGIYHFTYDEKGEINLNTLKMVYPLDTKFSYEDIKLDHSGKNILLFTSDKENHYLSIIDRKTMTLVDTFTIGEGEAYLDNWVYDDFFVVRTDKISVFSLGENGRYTKAFAVDYQKMKETIGSVSKNEYFLNWNSYFDWNGTTLVVVDKVTYADVFMRSTYSCNFYVAAMDETGLAYYGEYDSSLTTNGLHDGCRFVTDTKTNPIRIQWSK